MQQAAPRNAGPAPRGTGSLVLACALAGGLSCGSLEPVEVSMRPTPPACALIEQRDVADVFGAPVERGEAMGVSETSYCTFRFVGRDDRVVVSLTEQVQPFARRAFMSGSDGEAVPELGRHASWNENMLVVLRGATLYVSHASPAASVARGSERARHVALAQRALARLKE